MDTPQRRHLAPRQLLTRLPEGGAKGSTLYLPSGAVLPADSGLSDVADDLRTIGEESTTGIAVFATDAEVLVVEPPFPIGAVLRFEAIEPAPMVELLERPRAVGVFLLRLGGYSVGFFRGESLIASKTGRRFVKNRHRKGGQSQRRFDRIREKQTDELFDAACEDARRTLTPYEGEIEHAFLGGTRQTVMAFRKECQYFERFGGRLMARLLPVSSDPRLDVLEAIPREVCSSELYVLARAPIAP